MISMKYKNLLRVLSLLVLLASFVPLNHAAQAAAPLPPVDMFQLPWEQGLAWVAIDGFDNGSDRLPGSPHNYLNGGAIDFAPHNNMIKGENTSNFWVTAAADGTIVEISKCHMKIAHASGWITEYQHLANVQVKLGDVVARNQRLAVIANASSQPVCPGSEPPDIPHLHFVLRPTMVGATFAGWEFRYNWFWNNTTFRKGGQTLGLYKPLLNVFDSQPTPTPITQPTNTPGNLPSATPTLFGPYISTEVSPPNIDVGESTFVTVKLNNVPADGFTSVEITCPYDTSLFEVSNIVVEPLFGADAATAINGPQNGRFIAAIAGSKGNKATTSGTVLTFSIKGLQIGQAYLGCEARVSKGDNVLTQIPEARAYLTVLGDTPTPNTTQSPAPTFTPSPAPSTSTVSPAACDQAQFIADITVPPGTIFAPGTNFTKTWRLQNVGTCAWTTAYYQIVFFSGEQMSAPSFAMFPVTVGVGQTVDFSLQMTAPTAAGSYRGYWMLKNANGALFGIGPQANEPFSVDILVSGSTATLGPPTNSPTPSITPGGPTATPVASVAYDFAANACAASWFSGAGQLPCPGIDGDPRGFVLILNNPALETGATDTRQGLLTFPQNVQNGYIQGYYPPFHVQNGDRFQSTIGCEGGATSCYVAFRLDYQTGSDPIKTFWGPFLERYDGRDYSADVDLSSLAGKDVKFILTILSAGSPTGDRALWVGPAITRTNLVSNWLTFTNSTYGFEFKYPPQGVIAEGRTDNFARIDLPFVAGTNLREKYLEVVVAENANPCQSPLPTPNPSETVTINGITFLKQTGADAGVGHLHQWVAYSTVRGNACVSLDFILHSLNAGNFATPPPLFDFAAESAVFEQIVATYAWLVQAPTATPGFETPLPIESPTLTSTPTPAQFPTASASPTASNTSGAILTGQVIAAKIVTVRLYDQGENFVAAVNANPDGTFRFDVAAGTYTIVATANGFLRVQGSITLADGNVRAMPMITLLAGDIDDNNAIDQFDAMTIGMSYNTAFPDGADLNNDGIINVLDLELLARNYRKTGPVVWQ